MKRFDVSHLAISGLAVCLTIGEGSRCVMATFMALAPGSTRMETLPDKCERNSSRSSAMAKASGRGYTLVTRRWSPLQQQSVAILGSI
jgi:hypothetical protein